MMSILPKARYQFKTVKPNQICKTKNFPLYPLYIILRDDSTDYAFVQ